MRARVRACVCARCMGSCLGPSPEPPSRLALGQCAAWRECKGSITQTRECETRRPASSRCPSSSLFLLWNGGNAASQRVVGCACLWDADQSEGDKTQTSELTTQPQVVAQRTAHSRLRIHESEARARAHMLPHTGPARQQQPQPQVPPALPPRQRVVTQQAEANAWASRRENGAPCSAALRPLRQLPALLVLGDSGSLDALAPHLVLARAPRLEHLGARFMVKLLAHAHVDGIPRLPAPLAEGCSAARRGGRGTLGVCGKRWSAAGRGCERPASPRPAPWSTSWHRLLAQTKQQNRRRHAVLQQLPRSGRGQWQNQQSDASGEVDRPTAQLRASKVREPARYTTAAGQSMRRSGHARLFSHEEQLGEACVHGTELWRHAHVGNLVRHLLVQLSGLSDSPSGLHEPLGGGGLACACHACVASVP